MNVYREKMMWIPVRFNPEGKGYAYVASSEYIPGLIKIGASRVPPLTRLYTSSIPGVVIEAEWREDAPWALEKRLHAWLDPYRVDGEWYRCSASYPIQLVDEWKSEIRS